MISFPGGSCSRGNPKGAAVMQGSHGKMRKDGSNCLREVLQAFPLVHQGRLYGNWDLARSQTLYIIQVLILLLAPFPSRRIYTQGVDTYIMYLYSYHIR